MKTVTIFEASDGRRFESENECAIYEGVITFSAVIGLKPSDIQNALSGKDRQLGDVIEALGLKIARNRCANGGAKRRTLPKPPPKPTAPESAPAEQ
jgi:hypothetical protein